MLVSKSKFSKLAGVSRAAISAASSRGSLVLAVCGDKIDTDSEAAKTYMRKRGVDPGTCQDPIPSSDTTTINQAPPLNKIDPEDLEEMNLAQLCDIFGTDERFKNWTSAKKTLGEIRYKLLVNAEKEGTLIPRELVKNHIFGAIESSNLRLLTDTPKTVARRLFSLAKSGATVEEGEALVRKLLGDQLKNVTATAKRVIKNA